MNLNGHETDGVPAPSEFELGTWVSDDDGPPYAELMRLYEAARTLILDWQQRNEQLWKLYRGSVDVTNVYAAQEGIYRAEITDLRTEVARLRGALEQVEWVGIYHASSLPQDMRCPRCFRHRADGHKDDCSLAAALTPPAGEER